MLVDIRISEVFMRQCVHKELSFDIFISTILCRPLMWGTSDAQTPPYPRHGITAWYSLATTVDDLCQYRNQQHRVGCPYPHHSPASFPSIFPVFFSPLLALRSCHLHLIKCKTLKMCLSTDSLSINRPTNILWLPSTFIKKHRHKKLVTHAWLKLAS